jgi:hypothetical protein
LLGDIKFEPETLDKGDTLVIKEPAALSDAHMNLNPLHAAQQHLENFS